MPWIEHKQLLVGCWWSEERVQINDDHRRQRCGASSMKDVQSNIIREDEGIGR